MAGDKIIRAMKLIANNSLDDTADLMYGKVISVAPLKIKINENLIISQQFLILSKLVKEFVITTPTETIQLWTGLKLNDNVRMLRLKRGQLYYIIEKEE